MRIVVDALFRIRNSYCTEHINGALHCFGFAALGMCLNNLCYLHPDFKDRIKRRHWLLEDHRNFATADAIHLFVAKLYDVLAFEQNFSAHDAARGIRDELHQRKRRYGFTRTGFADNAEDFTLVDVEGDTIDSLSPRSFNVEVRLEILDFDEFFLSHCVHRVERRRTGSLTQA